MDESYENPPELVQDIDGGREIETVESFFTLLFVVFHPTVGGRRQSSGRIIFSGMRMRCLVIYCLGPSTKCQKKQKKVSARLLERYSRPVLRIAQSRTGRPSSCPTAGLAG